MAQSFNVRERPKKRQSYEFLFANLTAPVSTAIMMPSDECKDVQFLMERGVITTDTKLYVIERDDETHLRMVQKLKSLGFERERTLFDVCSELHEVEPAFLPPDADLIFIDLFGSILLDDARWMANVLAPRIRRDSLFALTLQARHRNNEWIEEFWRSMVEKAPEIVTDFVTARGYDNQFVEQPTLWMKAILHGFDFGTTVFAYTDHPSNVWSEMLALRMEDFEARPDADAYLSHAMAESLMDMTRVRAFEGRRIGETPEETARKRAEAMQREREKQQRLERLLTEQGKDLVVKRGRYVRVIMPDRTWQPFGSVLEVCQHYGIE